MVYCILGIQIFELMLVLRLLLQQKLLYRVGVGKAGLGEDLRHQCRRLLPVVGEAHQLGGEDHGMAAGIPVEKLTVCKDYGELMKLCTEQDKPVYIMPTYTAMLNLREKISKTYGFKDFWE